MRSKPFLDNWNVLPPEEVLVHRLRTMHLCWNDDGMSTPQPNAHSRDVPQTYCMKVKAWKLRRSSHEVVLKIASAILVAARSHSLIVVYEIISMVSLPGFLLAVLLDLLLFLLASLMRRPVSIAEFFQVILSLLSEIGVLLDFGLVQSVDDWIQSLLNVYSLDLVMSVVTQTCGLFRRRRRQNLWIHNM